MPAARHLKELWWKRQDVSDTASAVEQHMKERHSAALLDTSQMSATTTTTTCLTRKEVVVGKLLGEGSFSVVHEVTQREQCQKYAIKFIKGKLLKNKEKFQQGATDLLTEATFLSKLDHPGIIKLRGIAKGGATAYVGGHYDSFFLLTDRLTSTLDQRIKAWSSQGRVVNNDEVLLATKTNYALQLAQALHYLHDRRIVYRDLKPQNVGFLGKDNLQLFDFGSCMELPESSFNNKRYHLPPSTGTARYYCSPEMLNDGYYNTKTDVFSFGMVLYEMLTHQAPYHGLTEREHMVQMAIQGRRPQIPKDLFLPHPLMSLLRKCWAQEVILRIDSDQLVKGLQYYLTPRTTTAVVPQPSVGFVVQKIPTPAAA